MRVALIERAPDPGCHSIEKLFDAVVQDLPADIETIRVRCSVQSRGVLRRIVIMLQASVVRSDLKHVAGDVHFAVLLLPRKRTVLTVHDCGTHTERSHWGAALYRLVWLELPVRHAAAVTVISAATKRELIRLTAVPASKVVVIPDCVSRHFVFKPNYWNQDCPRILQVGAKPNKNLARIAAALAGIRCELRVVGKLSTFDWRALEEHRISYRCYDNVSENELVQLYETCDLVSFPSLYEGFGMPILEGQAIGRPVLTSNRSPMKDVSGAGAHLVDPEDSSSIRTGFLKLIADKSYRSRLVDAGLENVKRYCPDAIARQYGEVYRQVWANVLEKASYGGQQTSRD